MRRTGALLILVLLLNGCAIHQFSSPNREWTTQNGQLSYHGKKRALIGEVLVRYSNRGDFEFAFTKGPGLSLLSMHTDEKFARVQGPLVGLPWSGPIAHPPERAAGWLKVREEILRNPKNSTIRVKDTADTFVLQF